MPEFNLDVELIDWRVAVERWLSHLVRLGLAGRKPTVRQRLRLLAYYLSLPAEKIEVFSVGDQSE